MRASRILLAEDDDEMRRLLGNALRREGYIVLEMDDGQSLMDRLTHAPMDVDLIISDIRMPGLSGLQVLERFRRSDAKTPVVLITAFGDSDTVAVAKNLGAQEVLSKPFEIDDLRATVRRILPSQL